MHRWGDGLDDHRRRIGEGGDLAEILADLRARRNGLVAVMREEPRDQVLEAIHQTDALIASMPQRG